MGKNIFIGVLLFVVGFLAVGYQYQGKTAKQWASVASQSQKEASQSAELISEYAGISPLQCTADAILVDLSPTPTPTPDPYAKMPSWCRATIYSYDSAYQPLGYSQGAINQIIKQNNPECATY